MINYSHSNEFVERLAYLKMNYSALNATKPSGKVINTAGKANGEASNATNGAKKMVLTINYSHSNKFAKKMVFQKANSTVFKAKSLASEAIRVASELIHAAGEATFVAGKTSHN